MKFGIVYGDRYAFRDGAPTGDGVLLSDELAMMYHAMDFASATGPLQGLSTADRWQLLCGGEACVVGFVVDWKATRASRLLYSCVLIICVCLRYLEPTGLHEKSTRWESKLTTWTHHVSSWYAVITEPSPVAC